MIEEEVLIKEVPLDDLVKYNNNKKKALKTLKIRDSCPIQTNKI